MPRRTNSLGNADLLDGLSLFATVEAFGLHHNKPRLTLNYPALKGCLDAARRELDFPHSSMSLLFASVDSQSEGQSRFLEMLRTNGYSVDVSDFRDNYRSMPPGAFPSSHREGAGDDGKPQGSLAARIAYALGLLARHEERSVLVVSHSFELYAPMHDLAQRDTRVALVCFASMLDGRWKRAGVLDDDPPFPFVDLDEHSVDLLGIDTAVKRSKTAAYGSDGLSRL